jgi:peptidoglycan/LPS O-acetylase OafA/YrhL
MATQDPQQPTQPASHTTRLGSQPALDGLRACAVAAVFGLHAASDVFAGGFLGVDIFFTLSAFLITSLVLEEAVARRGSYGFRAFYWRRAVRLGPALLVWLILIAPPAAIYIGERGSIVKSTALVLAYVSNLSFVFSHGPLSGLGGAYGHGWSLAVEEQFYLVWPVLLVLLVRRVSAQARRRMLVLALPLSVVAALAAGAALTPNQNYFLPTGHLLPLLAGCLAADLRMYGAPAWLTRTAARSTPPVLIGLGLLACVVGSSVVAPHTDLHIPVTTFAGLGTALIILHVCATSDSLTSRLLSGRVMRWVGQRSYGYYLFSLTILGALVQIPGMHVRFAGPLALALSTVVVAASYRWVEKPALRHKHRFDTVRTSVVEREPAVPQPTTVWVV